VFASVVAADVFAPRLGESAPSVASENLFAAAEILSPTTATIGAAAAAVAAASSPSTP
jgi:hypothetical protein